MTESKNLRQQEHAIKVMAVLAFLVGMIEIAVVFCIFGVGKLLTF